MFRAHCTQLWDTWRLAFYEYMLVLHYQVYGEGRFPKLFSYKKLYLPFRKISKWANCTKSKTTKVPKFCTDIRLFKCDCMSKKIWKGVFRAHCPKIWGTSRLAFDRYVLVLHCQVYGEERFPKLFSYEKLFVRFAKYHNAKRAHWMKSESAKVPKFCTYCFNLKLHVWFCYKIWKGVFRAHCTQIWGTSRLAFDRYMLVLHNQVYGEERLPKLFFYEKLFVRFAKYQNAKRAHCTKSESTKVPKFCPDIRLFKCDCMSKKNFENTVLIQSHMYDFVTKFEKGCLGVIHPNLRYLKAGLRPVHVSFTLSSIWWRKISKIIFRRKVIRPFRKISKCETGSLHEKRKC